MGCNVRIAVMIVSLVVCLILFLQSCAVHVGGSLSASEALKQGAAIGVLLAFLFVLAACRTWVCILPEVAAGDAGAV
jgi:hypothetical protein